MREILFRGKRISNGEWVEGGIMKTFHPNFEHENEDAFLKQEPNCYCICTGRKDVFVEQESIGQFTGLTDKNGKKIFGGDILQYSIEEDQAVFVGAVKFGEFNPDGGARLNTNVGFYVELVDLDGQRTYMRKDIGYWVKFRKVEVIGNIHDNPELLGGAEHET